MYFCSWCWKTRPRTAWWWLRSWSGWTSLQMQSPLLSSFIGPVPWFVSFSFFFFFLVPLGQYLGWIFLSFFLFHYWPSALVGFWKKKTTATLILSFFQVFEEFNPVPLIGLSPPGNSMHASKYSLAIRDAILSKKCSFFEHCSNGGGSTHVQKLCRKLSCVLEVI